MAMITSPSSSRTIPQIPASHLQKSPHQNLLCIPQVQELTTSSRHPPSSFYPLLGSSIALEYSCTSLTARSITSQLSTLRFSKSHAFLRSQIPHIRLHSRSHHKALVTFLAACVTHSIKEPPVSITKSTLRGDCLHILCVYEQVNSA